MPNSRVVVAMSGGVDSSVAAALLLEQGYDVVGVTMRLWTEEDPEAPRHHRRCCSVEDTDDARAACDRLGVAHYVLNFEREFAAGVVDTFVRGDARGRPPNPDKPDSADICFIPSGDYRSFVAKRVESPAGAIVDAAGNRVGEHAGIANYTVGQ